MPRGLQPDDAFEEKLAELVPDKGARYLVLLAIQLTICADPTVGIPMDDPPDIMWYFFVPDAPAWGIPRMTVLYSFDEENVYLNWVDLSESQPRLT